MNRVFHLEPKWEETNLVLNYSFASSGLDIKMPGGASRQTVKVCLDQIFRGIYGLRVTPEPFEFVIGAGGLGKDMYDEIAVVHQYPFGGIVSLNTDRKLPSLLQKPADLIADRMPMPWIGR
jgi:hypothetical protein